jgi:hypothetical protein
MRIELSLGITAQCQAEPCVKFAALVVLILIDHVKFLLHVLCDPEAY